MSDTATVDPEVSQAMLKEMLQGHRHPMDTAESHGIDVLTLAYWSQDTEHHRPLAALSCFLDLHAQLVASQSRMGAVLHLNSVVVTEKPDADPKLRRQAAVDLLKLDFKSVRTEAQLRKTGADSASKLESIAGRLMARHETMMKQAGGDYYDIEVGEAKLAPDGMGHENSSIA